MKNQLRHEPTFTSADIDRLPAFMTLTRYAELFGENRRVAYNNANSGKLAGAVLVNGRWYVRTRDALRSYGLIDDEV